MAIKAKVTKLDEVPEALRSLYVEKNGTFYLDAEGVEFEEDVQGLKRALEKERGSVADLKTKLNNSIDPAEHQRLKDLETRLAEEKAKAEGDWKSLEKQLVERHTKALEAAKTRETRLMQSLEAHLIDAAASAEISAMKGSVKGLLPHVRPYVKVVEADGKFVAQVVDAEGRPRVGDGQGTLMSIKQLVEEMRGDRDLARLFDGTGSSGGGSKKSQGGPQGGPNVIPFGDDAAFLANLDAIADGKVQVGGPTP